MFEFIKNLFNKKIKTPEKEYNVSFDFIEKIKNNIEIQYSNGGDIFYDIINYLLNRYNIPLDSVYVHNIGLCGSYVTRHKTFNLNNKYNLSGHLYNIKKFKFLMIPEPTSIFALQVCIHEIFHWHLKHNSDKYTNTLIVEYEAERMSKTFINKMFCGSATKVIYNDLINEYIISNVESYTDKHVMPKYVKVYLDSIRESVEN